MKHPAPPFIQPYSCIFLIPKKEKKIKFFCWFCASGTPFVMYYSIFYIFYARQEILSLSLTIYKRKSNIHRKFIFHRSMAFPVGWKCHTNNNKGSLPRIAGRREKSEEWVEVVWISNAHGFCLRAKKTMRRMWNNAMKYWNKFCSFLFWTSREGCQVKKEENLCLCSWVLLRFIGFLFLDEILMVWYNGWF